MELEDFVESQGVSMDDFEAQCQQYAQAKGKNRICLFRESWTQRE